MNGYGNCGIYIHIYTHNVILFSHKKDQSLAICDNMDGPCGHYAQWNKSDRERQIPNDITYRWNLKQTKQNKKKKTSS